MGIAKAYEVFYRALHAALLSNAGVQTRLATLVFSVQHLQKGDIPDEQIWNRLSEFVRDAKNRTWADESLGLVLTDDEAAAYIEQALSLFGAIAIVYGQQHDNECTH